MKLSIKAAALACGIMWGVCIFLWTLLNALGMEWGSDILYLLIGIYPFYDITIPGSFVGLIAGFIDGALGAAILVWLYNKFAK